MKRFGLVWIFSLFSLCVFSQNVAEQAIVINVEVPVRVYDNSIFVDDLTINDFEILEEGIPQKIEAVYLIKKMAVERSEEKRRFNPDTKRNYFLYFEVASYRPRIGEGLAFFINNIFSPQDDLYITTPLQTYRMKEGALQIKSKDWVSFWEGILPTHKKIIFYS